MRGPETGATSGSHSTQAGWGDYSHEGTTARDLTQQESAGVNPFDSPQQPRRLILALFTFPAYLCTCTERRGRRINVKVFKIIVL